MTDNSLNNQALQLGIAVGVAIYGSIASSVDKKRIKQGKYTPEDYEGARAVFYFVIACLVAWAVSTLVFYKLEPQWTRGYKGDPENAGIPNQDGVDDEKGGSLVAAAPGRVQCASLQRTAGGLPIRVW